MAQGHATLQAIDDFFAGEMITDETHAAFGIETVTVK